MPFFEVLVPVGVSVVAAVVAVVVPVAYAMWTQQYWIVKNHVEIQT